MPSRQGPSSSTETADRIARAAEELFLANGYKGTTMSVIAAAAGVAVQTLYNVAGSKAAVLSLVLDRTVSGPETPRPVPEFMEERTRHLESQTEIVAALADWFAEVHPRSSDLFEVIRDGAAVDTEVARLHQERARRRLENYALAAQLLAENGPTGMGIEETAALIWAVGHPTVYRRLVVESGWSLERYREWVRAGLIVGVAPEV